VRLRSAVLALLIAVPLAAQNDRPRVEVALSAVPLVEGPAIATANLLADRNTRELLTHGFTAGLHFRLELWRKGGWFDDLEERSEWDVLVSYDPTKQLYNVVRRQDNRLLENFGGFTTAEAADAHFGRPFRVALRPHRGGTYYYNLIVEVRTLTESDLDALQQWLRGTKAQGRRNPLGVIGKGVGKLLSRVLGGDKRHYETRSGIFRV
jgi:hypothetical protein